LQPPLAAIIAGRKLAVNGEIIASGIRRKPVVGHQRVATALGSRIVMAQSSRAPPGGKRPLFEHDLFGKPVSTPHQVRGRLFPDHALV
jgi:hypothetical protein